MTQSISIGFRCNSKRLIFCKIDTLFLQNTPWDSRPTHVVGAAQDFRYHNQNIHHQVAS